MALNSYIVRPPRARRFRLVTRALHSNWLYYGAAATGLILHLVLALPIYEWYDRVLAWLPLVIFLVLLRRYVLQSYKSMPLLVLIALQIYIFFSLPQFSQENLYLTYGEIYSPTSTAVTSAMLLTVVGELVFIFGYYAASAFSGKFVSSLYRANPVPVLSWRKIAILYSLLSFIVYTTATLSVNYIPVSIRFLMIQLFNVYLGLAILLYLGHTYNLKRLLASAYLLVLGMSFVGLIQGMLSSIVGPLVLLFFAKWIWGIGFDFRWVLVALLAILFINPVKNEFRSLPSWYVRDISSADLVQDRLADWSQAFESVWVEGDSPDSLYKSTASRTSELLSFTQAIDYVPYEVPYNAGEGMGDAMLFWIPRILWPYKGGSTDLLYNRYAVTFRYLGPEQVGRTAVGISIFAEGYWNFGTLGVIVFLFSSGALLGTLFGNNGKTGQVSTLVCIVYVAPTILVLQALCVTLASLPSFLIGVALVLRGLSLASRIMQLHSSSPEVLRRC